MLDQSADGNRGATAAVSLASFATHHPLRYLWGLAAGLWIVVSTLVLGIAAIAMMLITRRSWSVDVIGRWWGRGIVRVCGIDLSVEGLQRLRPGQSYVLISNHLSNFDIWCTLAIDASWFSPDRISSSSASSRSPYSSSSGK